MSDKSEPIEHRSLNGLSNAGSVSDESLVLRQAMLQDLRARDDERRAAQREGQLGSLPDRLEKARKRMADLGIPPSAGPGSMTDLDPDSRKILADVLDDPATDEVIGPADTQGEDPV
ncbi:MAG TPA: hypothetical protein VHQ86_00270 [Candidatus Saccharimonadia bacterium]|jgi:hypothetical protein|nr:hypothetical protein [Candidatus Saccharimonadia bacterium]